MTAARQPRARARPLDSPTACDSSRHGTLAVQRRRKFFLLPFLLCGKGIVTDWEGVLGLLVGLLFVLWKVLVYLFPQLCALACVLISDHSYTFRVEPTFGIVTWEPSWCYTNVLALRVDIVSVYDRR